MSGSKGVGGVFQGPFPRNGKSYQRNLGAYFGSKINPTLFHGDKWHIRSLQQFAHKREACIRKRPVTGSVRIDNKGALRRTVSQVAVRSKAPADYHHRLATPILSRTSTLAIARLRQAPVIPDGNITKPQIPRRGWGGYAYASTHSKHVSGNWYYTVNPMTSTSLDYHSHPTRNTHTECLADDSIVQTGYWFNKKTKERSWTYPRPLMKKLHGSVPAHLVDVETDSDCSDDDSMANRQQPEKAVSKVNMDAEFGHNSSSYGRTARGILSYKKNPSSQNLQYYLDKKLNPHLYPGERRWKK